MSTFIFLASLSLLPLFAPTVNAFVSNTYQLDTQLSGPSFFDGFDFFTESDPTQGFVTYINAITASTLALTSISPNGTAYIGVDHTSILPSNGPGRKSVRISSKKAWTHGLVIVDLAHMPGSVCGTWPALWMLGPNWPNGGEIDIIEGVNSNAKNLISLHTSTNCTIAGTSQLGTLQTSKCDASVNGNSGCGVSAPSSSSYGTGFNDAGGGIYATEWTSDYIRVWYFPRSSIPMDLNSRTGPDPSTWGLPQANFQGGCEIDSHFYEMRVVFDNTFCGDWAGGVWPLDGICAPLDQSGCVDFVAANPRAFGESFWSVNSVAVFTLGVATTSTSAAASSSKSSSHSTSTSISISRIRSTSLFSEKTAASSTASEASKSSSHLSSVPTSKSTSQSTSTTKPISSSSVKQSSATPKLSSSSSSKHSTSASSQVSSESSTKKSISSLSSSKITTSASIKTSTSAIQSSAPSPASSLANHAINVDSKFLSLLSEHNTSTGFKDPSSSKDGASTSSLSSSRERTTSSSSHVLSTTKTSTSTIIPLFTSKPISNTKSTASKTLSSSKKSSTFTALASSTHTGDTISTNSRSETSSKKSYSNSATLFSSKHTESTSSPLTSLTKGSNASSSSKFATTNPEKTSSSKHPSSVPSFKLHTTSTKSEDPSSTEKDPYPPTSSEPRHHHSHARKGSSTPTTSSTKHRTSHSAVPPSRSPSKVATPTASATSSHTTTSEPTRYPNSISKMTSTSKTYPTIPSQLISSNLNPTNPQQIATFTLVGCLSSPKFLQSFSQVLTNPLNSLTSCLAFCKNYTYAGVYSQQCFCGNQKLALVLEALAEDGGDVCNLPCPGNASQFCGDGGDLESEGLGIRGVVLGGASLTVYQNLSPLPNLNSANSSTSTSGLTSTVTLSTSSSTVGMVEGAHFSPTGTGILIPSPSTSVMPALEIFGVGMGAVATSTVTATVVGNGSAGYGRMDDGSGNGTVVSSEGDGGRELKRGLGAVLGVLGFVFWAL